MKSRLLIGILISATLLGLLLWRISPAQLGQAFSTANQTALLLTTALHLLVLCLKVGRWKVVLSALPAPPKQVPWLPFDALFLGYFGNYALPAKLGELGRSLLYARRSGRSLPEVLATILVERFIDALVLISAFLILATTSLLPERLPNWVQLSLYLAAAGTLAGLLALFLARRFLSAKNLRATGSEQESGLLRRVLQLLSRFGAGLAILERPRVAARALIWTLLIWAVEALAVWICLHAFGASLPISAAILVMVVTSFAIAAPSAPGGVGVHQWVTVLLLAPYGAAEPSAAAASLVLTVAVILWVVPLGLFGLWRQGYSTAQLRADYDATH